MNDSLKPISSALIILSIAGLLVAVAVVALSDVRGDVLWLYLLSAVSLAVAVAPLAIGARSGRIDFLEPVYAWSALYFLYFGGRAAYIAGGPRALDGSPNLSYTDYASFVAPTVLALVGHLFFLLGYYSGVPKFIADRLPRLSPAWNTTRNSAAFFFCIVVGVAAFAVLSLAYGLFYSHTVYLDKPGIGPLFAPGSFLGSLGILKQFLFFAVVLGTILYYSASRKSLPLLVLLGILIVGVFMSYFLTGAKQGILYTILYFVVPLHYLKTRIRLRAVLIVSVIIFVSFPLFYLYREETEYARRESFAMSAVIEDLGTFQKSLVAETRGLVEYTTASVMNRFAGVDSLALAMRFPDVAGSINDKYSSLLAFVMWIPRVAWPGKPEFADFQIWFGHEFWGIPQEMFVQIPPTQIGELIILFGNWGVIGMILYGIIARAAYRYLIENRVSRIGVFLYPFVLIKILGIETTFGYGLVLLLYLTICILVLSKWISGHLFAR